MHSCHLPQHASWFESIKIGSMPASDPPVAFPPESPPASPIAALARRAALDATVARAFAVPPEALSSASRGRAPIAFARQAAMYLAHIGLSLSLTDVGRLFARDRTTVAHACGVVEDRRDDPTLDRALELLEAAILCEVRRAAATRPTFPADMASGGGQS